MRRIIGIALAAAAVAAFVLTSTAASDGGGNPKYKVELDTAFGLVVGADFKIAGVRAGKITDFKLNRKTKRAIVEFEVRQQSGFKRLRTDARCESRPQSLIGEYFVDCEPGKAATELKPGATIPVEQTASTVAPDLVNNILRLPERQRLRLILNELGTGLAARGDDLNTAIRRAVPALRETDKVLAILAQENQTLASLTTNADRVVTALANRRADVGRWVLKARDTAVASANRRVALQQTFADLPGFLEQLRPAMRDLGAVADAQTPALTDLRASATQLRRLFNNLGPFANASRPAFRTLADASKTGRLAVKQGRPTIKLLSQFAAATPELGKNLALVLEDLYNRDRAVEPDARSPGGKGWNGFEALMGYVFYQSQAINIFDQNGYLLKVALYPDTGCEAFTDAAAAKANPARTKKCSAALGPSQPGVSTPDPTATASPAQAAQVANQVRTAQQDAAALQSGQKAAASTPPATPAAPATTAKPPIDLGKTMDNLIGRALNLPVVQDTSNGLSTTKRAGDPAASDDLLSYLLGK